MRMHRLSFPEFNALWHQIPRIIQHDLLVYAVDNDVTLWAAVEAWNAESKPTAICNTSMEARELMNELKDVMHRDSYRVLVKSVPPLHISREVPALSSANSADEALLRWNENAREQRLKDGQGFSSMLEEFATLGVLPSRGKRRERFGGIE